MFRQFGRSIAAVYSLARDRFIPRYMSALPSRSARWQRCAGQYAPEYAIYLRYNIGLRPPE